jgi:hypothetical protein
MLGCLVLATLLVLCCTAVAFAISLSHLHATTVCCRLHSHAVFFLVQLFCDLSIVAGRLTQLEF